VSVRPGEGVGGSDRVTLTWPDGAIINQWVEVTVKSSGNTGLAEDDLFCFGAAVADVDGDGQVAASDLEAFKSEFGLRGGFLTADFNNDGRVGLDDFVSLRRNFGSIVLAPTIPSQAPAAAPDAPSDPVARSTEPIAPLEADEVFGDTNDSVSVVIPGPALTSDLLLESLVTGQYISEPRSMAEDRPSLAATTEYDLRPLSDDSGTGEGDDLLTDILAESALMLPL
jgi:hypothetical protein